MRVLCSTTPMEGVFGPFVPLGTALLAAGHDVVVATGSDLQSRVQHEGFAFAAAGPTAMGAALTAMTDPAVADAAARSDALFAAAMFGGVMAPAKLPELQQLADRYRPDLIVHPTVDVAAPLLAVQRRLPSIAYGFGQPLDAQLVHTLARRVAPLWTAAGLEPAPDAGIYRDRYLDPCPPSLRGERGAVEAIAEPIRPEMPGDPNAPLPGWAAALGSRPIVYLSLGTVPLFNQPHKFVTLLAELAHEDLDVVVTIGELNDPTTLGAQPANVHIERWLPLSPLLPRCDAAVCHAGSGTTLAALCAGLPLVLVPQGADQHTNAAACQRARVARVLDADRVDSSMVRDAVLTVLQAGSVEQEAARRIAGEITEMPPATDIVADLERLLTSAR